MGGGVGGEGWALYISALKKGKQARYKTSIVWFVHYVEVTGFCADVYEIFWGFFSSAVEICSGLLVRWRWETIMISLFRNVGCQSPSDVESHLVRTQRHFLEQFFLGAFAKLGKKRILSSSCLSVCPHGRPTGCILMKFDILVFFDNLSKFKVSLKPDKNNGHFTWRPIYLLHGAESFLRS